MIGTQVITVAMTRKASLRKSNWEKILLWIHDQAEIFKSRMTAGRIAYITDELKKKNAHTQ